MSRSKLTDMEGRDPTRDSDILSSFRRGVERAQRNLDQRIGKPHEQTINPQTPPSRFISSTFSSPGSTIGKEEDVIVIELNHRYLLAGIEGESGPQCKITFNPDEARRVGDYRAWLPAYKKKQETLNTWGHDYELWRNDIEGLDLGLVGDRLERAIREAYNKYLLLDAGLSRLVLVVPSVVSHPVLEKILSTLFERWSYQTISLLPAPTMTAISAGLRSGLVIDVGWEETTITSVYEYREIQSHRSIRAMKELTRRLAIALKELVADRDFAKALRLDLAFVEQVLTRTLPFSSPPNSQSHADHIQGREITPQDGFPTRSLSEEKVRTESHEIEWPLGLSTEHIRIPKSTIADVIEQTLLCKEADVYPDDHELALPVLAFRSMLALSPDQRSCCMSRIMFVGDVFEAPWLRPYVLQEVRSLVEQTSWSDIKGQHIKSNCTGPLDVAQNRAQLADARYGVETQVGKDYVEDLVRKQKTKKFQQAALAELREIESLGPWAGASLLASLKVRGFVEVERERFLSQGLAGASRDTQISVIPQPQRMSSFGMAKPTKLPDRTSWTLAGWG